MLAFGIDDEQLEIFESVFVRSKMRYLPLG